MTRMMFSLFAVLLAKAVCAQYGDAYHKPNEMAINEAKWRASRSVATYGTGSTGGATGVRVINPMTVEEYFAIQKKYASKNIDPAKREEEVKKSAPQGYYEGIAAKYRMDGKDIAGLKHWDMAKPFGNDFRAAGFQQLEADHLSRRLYRVVNEGERYTVVFVPDQNILNAAVAYRSFQNELASGDFEKLLAYVLDFRYASLSAVAALDRLEQRFPEKRQVILMAKVFPVLYGYKGGMSSYFSEKEMKLLLTTLGTLYDEIPQMVLAEDKFVGMAVGYNEEPPLGPLYREALKKNDYARARELGLVTLMTDSSNAGKFLHRVTTLLMDHKYYKHKAPKEPIFTVDDVLAIHNHLKSQPTYQAKRLALMMYKMPPEQQAVILEKTGLSAKEFEEEVKFQLSIG